MQGAGVQQEGHRPSPFCSSGPRRSWEVQAGQGRPDQAKQRTLGPQRALQESAERQGGWVGWGAGQVQRKVSGEAGVTAWPLSQPQSQEKGGLVSPEA